MGSLKATLAGLNEKKKNIADKINTLSSCIRNAKERKSQTEVRKNTGIGMIVGGVIFAPFTLGASLGVTIAGAIITGTSQAELEEIEKQKNSYESEYSTLQTELIECRHRFDKEQWFIESSKYKMSILNEEKLKLEKKIGLLGRNLTHIRETQSCLYKISNKYNFLKINVESIEDLLEIGMQNKNERLNLLKDIEKSLEILK